MGFLFWQQEMKYVLPTPVPIGYSAKLPEAVVSLPTTNSFPNNQALYFHFFNPDCPCSRFNLKHFKTLKKQFETQVKIYAVIPAYADFEYAKEMLDDESIIVIQDTDDALANACGVYATPQAVVIDSQRKLFYRGNYNRTRYCTLKESNYAEIALTALVKGQKPPVFNAFATQSYGCELPNDL
ncbi:hypothetical protein SanaruYs_13160 [Chryseotalea sanaruensis]|uniref:DUF6436 domain-containing protein n=2 Tax=Chryseotalea sanaruensis TaxID=2482724 RepID=A0A401U888_9BACT|nr:hypothetical protein SanaruYs_13160 [Chryseotalea sanaruensis]